MSSNSHIVNYDDRTNESRYLSKSFDEEAAFRERMKAIEEYATSGAVTTPGAKIAGQRVSVAHRMGDRFDVRVQDPFTKKARTVVSHQYDLRGNRVSTDVAWTPGSPESVSAVFGVPFVSAFGAPSKPDREAQEEADRKAQEESDSKALRRAEHAAAMKFRLKDAEAKGKRQYVWERYGRARKKSDVPPEFRSEWVSERKRRRLPYE